MTLKKVGPILLLGLVSACQNAPAEPDGGQPPSPDGPLIQYVQTGEYRIHWETTRGVSGDFEVCNTLHVQDDGREIALDVDQTPWAGPLPGTARGNCWCYPGLRADSDTVTDTWCLCPGVQSLIGRLPWGQNESSIQAYPE